MFPIVKAKLSQRLDDLENGIDAVGLKKYQLQYVIAYNPERPRR
jgi:hypothetical protein